VIPIPRREILGNICGQRGVRIRYKYFQVGLLKLGINEKFLKNINKFLKINFFFSEGNKFYK
jgi:hypothetical protein